MGNSIDWQYRPNSYFWAKQYGIGLTSDIKGVERRRLYEESLEDGEELGPRVAALWPSIILKPMPNMKSLCLLFLSASSLSRLALLS